MTPTPAATPVTTVRPVLVASQTKRLVTASTPVPSLPKESCS